MRSMVVGVGVVLCATGVFAQAPMFAGLEEQSTDRLLATRQAQAGALDRTDLEELRKSGGVTQETVGDPYSFGRSMIYLGVVQTEPVDLLDDCTGYPPEGGRCVALNQAPAATAVDESDLGSILLPGKSTKTLLCFTVTHFTAWQWDNSTGSTQSAWMSLGTTVRIESDVLLDPSLINPLTGSSFDGEIVIGSISSFRQLRTLDPAESDFQQHSTTRSCTGGFISEMALRDAYGLSDAVIKDFFQNPMTVSFGAVGQVAMTSFATHTAGIRLYGDK